MDISLGVLFGIIAMVGWGTADFFVAKAVRKTSIFKTFIWSQTIGVVLFLLVFLIFFRTFPLISVFTIGLILLTAFLGVVSYLAFYKGLQIGKVSIISPIVACWAVVTVILSLIFLGESLSFLQSIGVGLAILGSVLASFKFKDLVKLKIKNMVTGVKYAVIAMLAWGTYFVFFAVMAVDLGWFLPILFFKSVAVFYLFAYSGFSRNEIKFPKKITLLVVLIGILETVAFLSYGMGISSEYTSIVAPVSAAFPAVTIILARVFFKETLEINQKFGIISVLTGLILLSL